MCPTSSDPATSTMRPGRAHAHYLPMRGIGRVPSPALASAVLRARDMTASLLLLVLFLPLMLLVAILIRLGSSGPALLRQERVGLHGQVFVLLKFRSMRVDAEANGPCWAAERDPRVTRLGAFLRAYRIDELPQLVNVLRGDMSLIGPRPERPCFVQQFRQIIQQYDERHRVPPGITGWAQVNYAYTDSIEGARSKLIYDLYYVNNHNIVLDLRIAAATLRVVLCRIGAR